MKVRMFPALMALSLSACASYNLSDTDRLALYEAHAGAPVKQIRYVTPTGWSRVDDSHISLDMRPGERWLLTLSGSCLKWNRGSHAIRLTPSAGLVVAKFDMVHFSDTPMGCRIEEIRPVDLKALRAGENALRSRS